MESLGGFRSFSAFEEVAAALILCCAALYCLKKSEMESLMDMGFQLSNENIFRLLDKKRLDPSFLHRTIKDIDDICSLEPWDLARESHSMSEDQVWYFFNEPCYKYKKSNRAHRRTNAGYWKVTGRGSKIKAKNGFTGDKKILTFYRHGPVTKEAKTEWVMHEYHIKDSPSYKKEFVFCRIERKGDRKQDTSTTDEGESRQLLVSLTEQLPPNDHSISSRSHSEETTHTSPQILPNHNVVSYPRNHSEQNSSVDPQLPNQKLVSPTQLSPNNHLISERNLSEEYNLYSLTDPHTQELPSGQLISKRNQGVENIFTNPQPLPDNNLIPYVGSHIKQKTPLDRELLPNHNISYQRNYQNHITNSQLLLPNHTTISYPRNDGEQDPTTSQQLLLNHNFMSHSDNQIEEYSPKNQQLQPNHIDESSLSKPGLPPNMVISNVAESPFQEGHPFLGDLNCFLETQTPLYHKLESVDSNGYWDLVNCQNDSEQVKYQINSLKDFQSENSCEDTGQAITHDLNSSKSDGRAYAEDSSDMDTDMVEAWVNELFEDIAEVADLN